MRIKFLVVALATAVGCVTGAVPAAAMGSGNPYQDLQVGVTYTVYQPTYVAGLASQHVGPNLVPAAPGVEQNLLAVFGKKGGRTFNITEGNPMTSDIGEAYLVRTVTVQGQRAKIYAYCYPAPDESCTFKDIARKGGYLDVTLPAGPNLRETRVWVETHSKPITGKQLIRIARGLRTVG